MSEQELVKLKVPKTCKECFNSSFKRARPHCHYEKAYHIKQSVLFFKQELGMDLGIDVKAFIEDIKPLCQQCLSTIDKRAEKIHQERMFQNITETLTGIKQEIDDIKNNKEEKEEDTTQIYKKQKEPETPIRKVKKKEVEVVEPPEIKMQLKQKEKSGKQPTGGWKFFQRNIKKKNIPKYLKEFKEKNPEYQNEVDKLLDGAKSEFVDLKLNKSNNWMIRYRDFE